MVAAIRLRWWRLKRRWGTWHARLRRNRRAVALAVIVWLVMSSEPLMCIIHCDLWLPAVYGSYLAGTHQHHHHHTGASAGASDSQAAAAPFVQPSAATFELCFLSAGGSDVPFHVPPSPVHEMLPTVLIPLLVALALVAYATAPPDDAPTVFFPPPLRPPTSFAA
jgi:hypothetical protein